MIAGRYALVREIGRGGTGAVWLGHDELLGRAVALKRIGLLPGADETDLARAEREARLSARLHHPHVVAIFDVVADADSRAHWLVMEHVDGRDLAQLVRDVGPLPPDRAADLIGQVASALTAAHAAGMVHRDVKPSNILVDDEGRAKLTDFGIARLANDPSLTQTGMVTGSPTYLAPEIASGSRGDEAADVWSLGATLFHVLSGRPPHETGDVLSTLYRVVNDEPPRLPSEVSGWLAPLLDASLVKDPARRWSMREVHTFLRDRQLPPGWVAPAAVAATPTLADDATTTVPLTQQAGTRKAGGKKAGTTRDERSRDPLLVGLLVLVVAALSVAAFVIGRELTAGPDDAPSADAPATQTSPSASPTPTPTPSPSPSESETPEPDQPTAAGMRSFIEQYVAAVGADPSRSWEMLTANFQAESGGFTAYEEFWSDAENGRVDEFVSVDPENLVVAYQVTFDNFPNGPGPTVLQLTYEDGEYLIDGESSEGFVPAE